MRSDEQLLAEAADHAGLVGEPIAAVADPRVVAVLVPQPLGGREQERVDVAGHLDVGAGAGDLVDHAGPGEPRQVDRDADHLDEEELREQAGDLRLDARAALVRIAEVADLVVALDPARRRASVASMLWRSISSCALRIAISASCWFALPASASSLRIRSSTRSRPSPGPAPHGRGRRARSGCRRRARRCRARRTPGGTSRRARSRRGRGAPRRRTGAPSRARARRRPRATAAASTSVRDSSSVRVALCQRPRCVVESDSTITGATSRPPKRCAFSQS